jgi:G patch domain-containing protein 1
VPLEFFAPVSSSIGVQLLQKMGWRQGRGIGSSRPTAGGGQQQQQQQQSGSAAKRPRPQAEALPGFDDIAELAGFRGPAASTAAAAGGGSEDDEGGGGCGDGKWGSVAGVSIENTPLYVLEPKQDMHGLGFDPFEGAEEFRSRKRQKQEASRAAAGGLGAAGGSGGQQRGGSGSSSFGGGLGVSGSRPRGAAFGTGALEEGDTLGYLDDYVDADAELLASHKGQRKEVFAYEEGSDSGESV